MVNRITTEEMYRKEIADLQKQNHELMIRVKDLLEEIHELKNPKVSPCRAHDNESWQEDNERNIDETGNGHKGILFALLC